VTGFQPTENLKKSLMDLAYFNMLPRPSPTFFREEPKILYTPAWLTASSLSGTVNTAGTPVTFTVNASANSLPAGGYSATIAILNDVNGTTGPGSAVRLPTLLVKSTTTGPSFQGLGFLPGDTYSLGLGVSADGNVAVGQAATRDQNNNASFQAFRWTSAEGMTSLGLLSGGLNSQARAANSDGRVIAGQGSNTQAARWIDGVLAGLGYLPGADNSVANGVNSDGSVVVGASWGTNINTQGFRWTNGAMTGIGFLTGHNISNANGASADGTVIVGLSCPSNLGCFPSASQAFRWVNGTMNPLGFLQGGKASVASGVSADGAVVVGYSTDNNGNTQAFSWANGTMTGLGFLPGSTSSDASAVSADGATVVGSSGTAFRWTAVGGMKPITDLLTAAGVDFSGWSLGAATGVSADGTVIVGYGSDPSGHQQGWIARLPLPDTLTIDLSASPSIGGAVGGNGIFPSGSTQTVTAAANTGYIFVNWTESGNVVSTSPGYAFTLNANRTLVANFAPQSYTIAVNAFPSAGGIVAGNGTFPAGSSQTVTAMANGGYTFTSWTENGSVVNSSPSYTFTLNANRTLVANFTLQTYTITVSASPPAAGSVAGAGTFAAGSAQTVIATANSGYAFASWTENGVVIEAPSSYVFTLARNRNLVANFALAGAPVISSISLSAGFVGTTVAISGRGFTADNTILFGQTTIAHISAAPPFGIACTTDPNCIPGLFQRLVFTVPANAVLGQYNVLVQNTAGLSNPVTFSVAAFQGLDFLPGGNYVFVEGMNADGTVIVGDANDSSNQYQAFRWTNGSTTGLGYLSGGTNSHSGGVSSDGSVVVGWGTSSAACPNDNQAFRWSGGGLVGLAGAGCQTLANGTNTDGTVVVGYTYQGGPTQAFRWTNGNTNLLGFPQGYTNSMARGVSPDGATLIGNSDDNNRNAQGWRWTNGSWSLLGFMSGHNSNAPQALSADGSIVAGAAYNYQSTSAPTDYQAFRWTNGSFSGLGFLPSYTTGSGVGGMSAGGTVIVGDSWDANQAHKAFRWTAIDGMKSIEDLLTAIGASFTGWQLSSALAVSADGTTVGGFGTDPQGRQGAWIARIPLPPGMAPMPQPSSRR
jgi:probable HAF family extracellular repeat protein